jgi:protein SCO1/2
MGALALAACGPSSPPGKRYPLTGQVLAVHAARKEVVVRHDDVPGFMPAMTMPFSVRDGRLLEGRSPGDVIKATLVVAETSAWLEAIEKTGSLPLPADLPSPPPGTLAPGEVVPDARFVDQDGKPRTLSQWRGHALAVTFVFTRCPYPDFCPALDRSFAKLQAAIRAEAQLTRSARLLTVSFDPAHDTPAVLLKHAKALRADTSLWTHVTGTVEEVDGFGKHFGLTVAREGGEAGITHNLRTAVIDPGGVLVRSWNGADWEPEDVVAALREALAKTPGPVS